MNQGRRCRGAGIVPRAVRRRIRDAARANSKNAADAGVPPSGATSQLQPFAPGSAPVVPAAPV